METLILTNGYLPHRIVGWQRAMTLSFTGKVEVVETYGAVVRSPSRAFAVPSVVRLTRPVKRWRAPVRFSRGQVLARDGYRCQYCGEQAPLRALTLDHVLPRSRGGATSWTNVVTACRPCNAHKGGRTPDEAGMPLRAIPVRPSPRERPLERLPIGAVPEAWKIWVPWAARA
ncbi:MAG: HNH endonuclease [Sandaracinaceae bacterium]|nr:HNH endonuclease [Sandaracinaceae bacterium]